MLKMNPKKELRNTRTTRKDSAQVAGRHHEGLLVTYPIHGFNPLPGDSD